MIDKLKAIINKLKFRRFLAATKYLNLTGNRDNDRVSSDENENILRKKGLNSHKTIRKFINANEV